MVRVLHWNGRNVPPELRKLPAGQYIVAKYTPRKLSPEEEEGIRQAIQSIDRGEGVPWEKVRAGLDDMLKRKRKRRRKSR